MDHRRYDGSRAFTNRRVNLPDDELARQQRAFVLRRRPATTTVDAELFDTLQAAIDFVAALGGGVVYTELAGTSYAKGLKVPEMVRLEAARG